MRPVADSSSCSGMRGSELLRHLPGKQSRRLDPVRPSPLTLGVSPPSRSLHPELPQVMVDMPVAPDPPLRFREPAPKRMVGELTTRNELANEPVQFAAIRSPRQRRRSLLAC